MGGAVVVCTFFLASVLAIGRSRPDGLHFFGCTHMRVGLVGVLAPQGEAEICDCACGVIITVIAARVRELS